MLEYLIHPDNTIFHHLVHLYPDTPRTRAARTKMLPVRMRRALLLLVLSAALVAAQELDAVDLVSPGDEDAESPRPALLESCAALGFDADALDCRLCHELELFLEPSAQSELKAAAAREVTRECQTCCSDLAAQLEAAASHRHAHAVLAVSMRRLKRYPKVANFVQQRAAQIARLEVKETNARHPSLQFFDAAGNKMEEVRWEGDSCCGYRERDLELTGSDACADLCGCSVAHWDEDAIAEFVEAKLTTEQEAEEQEEAEIEQENEEEEVVEVEVAAESP
ncbi:hypothetical protein BBJ28_00014812 [Nothophytophthora sp. Chile5]|nr:hypothetical protein BBJ28_00014812 [Nothophytophthora sp. Chile5]